MKLEDWQSMCIKQRRDQTTGEKLSERASAAPATPPAALPTTRTVESTPKVKKRAPGLSKPRGRRKMNKTEAAFALILEARKRNGEILRYEWEGISLRWPDGMVFTPDFAVWKENEYVDSSECDGAVWKEVSFIETKGAFIEGDALVKFRAARAQWQEFTFELWQLKKGTWSKIL